MATLTTTPIKVFVSGETVTPTKLNELAQSTVALTAGTIVNADVSAGAAIALSKLATGALPTAITTTTANLVDASVTTAKLATVTAQALLPAGAVMPFARATAPAGWLIANGNTVPNGSGTVQGVTADFSALHAAIGTSFGTAGTLPDLRGIFVRGSGSQVLGSATYSGTLGTKQQDQFRSHVHAFTDRDTTYTASTQGVVGGGGSVVVNGVAPTTNNLAKNTVGAGGAETYPVNIALLYCIKF